jgi:FHS family L-fucose permease-like MFS transporter
MVGRFVGTALLKRVRADYLLFAYAFSNVLLLATALVTHGWVAITAIGLTCFFMSIQFPTIFSFGVRELGNLAMVGSSYIVMAVVGGAVLPLMMGLIDRHTGSLQLALLSPMACFGVVALYASRLKAATSPVGL